MDTSGEPEFRVGDLGGGNYAEVVGVRYNIINSRWGKMLNESGEQIGVILEFWPAPLPWLKFKIPFTSERAAAFLMDARAALEGEV